MKKQKEATEIQELNREAAYLRRTAEQSIAKILLLDSQSIAIRHELEQKRRGFRLMAELATTMGRDSDHKKVFFSVSRRINAALNMQRTAVLMPDETGAFKPIVLQGYHVDDEKRIYDRKISFEGKPLDYSSAVIVTGADSPLRLAELRAALELPFFIASPVVLQNRIEAVLVTGRLVEELPFLPRLGKNDVETVQTVGAYLAAMLAGQRLTEAEERAKIMLDATPLCCNFWDAHFNNIDCNQEAVRLFDLSSKEEYLQRFNDLSPQYQPNGQLSAELAPQYIREAFNEGMAKFEWMHQKLNGELIPSEIILVRVKHGDVFIVAGYTRDLRELKAEMAKIRQTEDDLRLARDLAEKNAKAKSEFLANMSHEIRTPMNGILGMIHLLTTTGLKDKQRNYVMQAEHSAFLLLRIINDILDFSKIEAGRMEIESINLSVHNLASNIKSIIINQIEDKGLSFVVEIDDDVPEIVVGDSLRLEQVLLNLLSNAVKFTPQGQIKLKISKQADLPGQVRLLFTVTDTGIGMTEDQVAGLFMPFAQADTSTTRNYGGTGLGLAISRSLVSLMDGEIWCQSVLGQGSQFFFTVTLGVAQPKASGRDKKQRIKDKKIHAGQHEALPRHDQDASSPLAEPFDEQALDALKGMRVLLAEDNKLNQLIASELLTRKGVEVQVVPNGRKALEAVAEHEFDLILMDIQMPEMDGLTAAKKLRSNPNYKNLPIIAMTAHAMAGDRELSLESGMDDHLTKPIDPSKLYAALLRWHKNRHSS